MIIFKEISQGVYELDTQSLSSIFTPNEVTARLQKPGDDSNIFVVKENQKGANCKFWIKNDNIPEGLLFKYSKLRGGSDDEPLRATFFGEFIVDMICHFTDMDHTSYYPCQIMTLNNEILVGSLSTNYQQGIYNMEFSAKNICERYRQSQYDNNDGVINDVPCNTIYGYLEQIKYLYPYRIGDEKLEEFKNYLLKLSLLDFVTLQNDRHWGNFGWMFNEQTGIKSLTYIPTFDNECCLCLDNPLTKIEAVEHMIKTTKNPLTRIIKPMTSAKKYSPVLGIKTAICENDKGSRLIAKKTAPGEPSNYDIFLKELVDEINSNKELREFYEKINAFKLEENMRIAGYFPESIITVSSHLYASRLDMLNKALENAKRGGENEIAFNG